MRYSEEVKIQSVSRYQAGIPSSALCSERGIARSTFFRWPQRYKSIIEKGANKITALFWICMPERSSHMAFPDGTARLLTSTFRTAMSIRKPQKDLIFHSDQGTQYTSYAFRKLLLDGSIKQSFSHPGVHQI